MVHSSPGDPEGRRLARKRAALLAQAGRIARVLEILLKRAEFSRDDCTEIVTELRIQEQAELQRAYGRIEPRKRFKGHSSHPLLEKRPISRLYLDENGKSGPEPFDRPAFFTLGAIAIAEEDIAAYCTRADEIKREFFGTTDFTFHEPDMRFRGGAYWFGGNRIRQLEFDQAIEGLIKDTSFLVFGAGIRKRAFEDQFVATGIDPYLPTDVYLVAIILLLERYVDFLATSPDKRLGRLEFESQGPKEDAEHQLEYTGALLDGSQWVPDTAFRGWLETGLRFTPKSGSSPMELADMFSRDLYEWICGDCNVTPKRWNSFGQRVYCRGDGQMGKFGVKIFPDSDIRDRIQAHRLLCGATCAEN